MGRVGFDRVVGAVYATARDPAAWPEALTLVSDHLGAAGGLLTRHCFKRDEVWIVVGRLRPDLSDLYAERHVNNGYARRLQWVHAGEPVLGSEVWDPAEAKRSALHADIIAPQRIAEQVLLTYAPWSGAGGSGGFAFQLGERAAKSSGDALRRLARLAPHLRQALDMAGVLASARAVERGLAAALDGLPTAVLLLDGAGRVLHANRPAEAMLRAGDGLVARGEPGGGPARLSAAAPAAARALARSVEDAARRRLGGRLRVPRPSGGPDWPVLVAPLPPDDAPPGPGRTGGRAPAVAVLVGGGPDDAPGADALRAAFGLTPAEARVLRAVAGGAGVPGAAAALGVSPETVRTHLARCFDATGARNQAALAAMVARLPRTGEDPPAAGP